MNCVSAILILFLILNPALNDNLPDHEGLVKDRLTDVSLSSFIASNEINEILFGEVDINENYDHNDGRINSIESIDKGFYESLLVHNQVEI